MRGSNVPKIWAEVDENWRKVDCLEGAVILDVEAGSNLGYAENVV